MQTSWFNIPENSDFSLHNLPYGKGIYNDNPAFFVAIGEYAINLNTLAKKGLLGPIQEYSNVFDSQFLNDFIALGKQKTSSFRLYLQNELSYNNSPLKDIQEEIFIPQNKIQMLVPIQVGDYTDFYSSLEHATNVGKMFRPDNPLLPNWKHIPVGYHGRASSIVISGTDIHRPKGQLLPANTEQPIFSPSQRMDFELEMAFIIGKETKLGERVNINNAEDYIFGMTIFNDWSARDIQKWEYVPLGPFLGKNFGSSISPWIVTLEALEEFRTAGPIQEPKPLEYLQTNGKHNFDIKLQVGLIPENQSETIICNSNFKYMYWSMAQQLAHHTINGCNIKIGDMMASGTISGKEKSEFGSMLELSWGGKEHLSLNNGEERRFIEDNDTIVMRAYAEKNGIRVGFGECTGKILPAN